MKLPTIPHDKALHVTYGAAFSLLGALASLVLPVPAWLGALALPAMVAVAKELRDRWAKAGTPDPWDAVATVAGAVPAVVTALLR